MGQDEALAIAGPVSMRLNVSSTTNTMDWMVKLIDVYPGGEAYNIAEGILRVHQDRDLPSDGTHLVDMVGTANVFLPGHSIRVDVSRQYIASPQTAVIVHEEYTCSQVVRCGLFCNVAHLLVSIV